MTERKLPDDRELEQYLQGDSPLSRRYREASGEGPPPELDEAILARARAELKRKPPSLNRYLAPVALAASVVLGVNLAWNLHQVEPVPAATQRLEKAAAPEHLPDPPPSAVQESAPTASAPELARRAPAAPPAKLEEKRAEARASGADAAADAREREQLAAAQEKDRAAAQSGVEEHMARRNEAESSRREMLQAQDAAGAAAPAAAPGSDPLELMARKASDARGMLPPGWYLMGKASRYEAAVDEAVYLSPPNSLVVWRTAPGVDLCGRLETETPAASLRGKLVRLKVNIRTQGVAGPDGRVSLFLTHARRGQVWWDPAVSTPVPASDSVWQPRETRTATVPDDAERVVYGAYLCGSGTLWIDDVQLETVGPAR